MRSHTLGVLAGVLAVLVYQTAGVARVDGNGPQSSTGLILGRVVDDGTGQPLAGVRVTRWRLDNGDYTQHEVITDEQGRFLCRSVPGGLWRVVAEHPGYSSGAIGRSVPGQPDRPLTLADGEHAFGIELRVFPAGGAIAGRVVDERGDPAVGVTVRALRTTADPDGRLTLSPLWSTTTDDRGRYRLVINLDGEYVVGVPASTVVSAPGSEPATPAGRGRSSGPPRVTVPDSPSFGGDGRRSYVVMEAPAAMPPLGAEGVPHLVYETAMRPEPGRGTPAIAIRNGQIVTGVDLTLTLAKARRVSGRLLRDGRPAGRVGVRIAPVLPGGVTSPSALDAARAITDAGGTFTLLGVPPGEHRLRVIESSDGQTWWTERRVDVNDRDIAGLDLELQRGAAISGRVVFDGDGLAPGPDAVARIGITPSVVTGASLNLPAPRAGADGTFTTAELLPGTYVIRTGTVAGWVLLNAMHEGRNVAAEPLHLGSAPVDDVVVTFTDRLGRIAGTVAGTSDTPVATSYVYAFPADYAHAGGRGSPVHLFKRIRPGMDGRYTIAGLPAGEYIVAAAAGSNPVSWTQLETIAQLERRGARVSVSAGTTTTQALRAGVIR